MFLQKLFRIIHKKGEYYGHDCHHFWSLWLWKNYINGALLSLDPKHRIIESITTRPPRGRDHPYEFLHLTLGEFENKRLQGEFLWVTPLIYELMTTLIESATKAIAVEERAGSVLIRYPSLSKLYTALKLAHYIQRL